MELELEQENLVETNEIGKEQKSFLETNLGKIINTALNVGIRFLLPDFLEEQVIDIKDAFLKGGIKEGVQETVQEGINLGKSAIGIATGNFENVSQIEMAVEKGGILDSLSNVIDQVVNKINQSGKISDNTANLIKEGKSVILDNIGANIEDLLTNQIKAIEQIETHCDKWEKYYNAQDLEGMTKEYSLIQEELQDVIPLENTIKRAREIENKQLLIQSNGNSFSLSEEQKEMAKVLS